MPTEINKIDEARTFLRDRVLLPALASVALNAKAKNTVRNSLHWIAHFHRIGDLVHYIGGSLAEPTPMYIVNSRRPRWRPLRTSGQSFLINSGRGSQTAPALTTSWSAKPIIRLI